MFTRKSGYRCKVGFIFLGGCGCNMCRRNIEAVDPGDYPDLSLFAANTDAKQLNRHFGQSEDERLSLWGNRLVVEQLGREEVTGGKGAGANPEVGLRAVMTSGSQEALRKFIGEQNVVLAMAGLGGGTGTPALPVVAELCVELNFGLGDEHQRTALAIAIMPRAREGRNLRAKEALAKVLSAVPTITIYNSHIRDYIEAHVPEAERRAFSMNDAHRVVDEHSLVPMIKILHEIIHATGETVHTDEADLRTMLRKGHHVFFGLARLSPEEVGTIAAEEVAERLFASHFQNADIAKCAEVVGLWYKGWAPYQEVEKLEELVIAKATENLPRERPDLELISGYRLETAGEDRWVALIAVAKEVFSKKGELSLPKAETIVRRVPVSAEFALDTETLSETLPDAAAPADKKAWGLPALSRHASKREGVAVTIAGGSELTTVGLLREHAEEYRRLTMLGSRADPQDWDKLLEGIFRDKGVKVGKPQIFS